MATVTGSIKMAIAWIQNLTGVPVPSGQSNPAVQTTQAPQFVVNSSGTGADAVDLKYTAAYTLTAAPHTFDLTSLLDVYGNAVNFARVRSISIINTNTTNANTLTFKQGASNPWTSLLGGAAGSGGSDPTITIPPSTSSNTGGMVMLAPNTTGWAVGGSNKTFILDPGSATIVANIEITGASV